MIPADAEKPADPRRVEKSPEFTLYPRALSSDLAYIIAHTSMSMPRDYPDTILDTSGADRLESHEMLRLPYEAQLAYLRGDFERVIRCFRKTEGHDALKLRVSATAMAATISAGDYTLYAEIETWVKGIAKAGIEPNVTIVAEFILAIIHVSLLMPDMTPAWFKEGDFAALPPQARPTALRIRAAYFMSLRKYESMLAVAQTALTLCTSEHEISFEEIYLRLQCAIACYCLDRADESKRWLEGAMNIALPHGFITPFAEYAVGLKLDECMKRTYPKHYDAVNKQWERVTKNWYAFHNQFAKENITLILSLREHQIASHAAHGVPYAKIAEKFNISAGRLRNIMNVIFGKLYIRKKDELSKIIS
jgi:DNA-binding CsgD family transcriptional regulator